MSQNASAVKQWSAGLLAAGVGGIIAAPTAAKGLIWLAVIPAIVLWGMDAYYLSLEHRFRRHFDDIRRQRLSADDAFLMSPHRAAGDRWLLVRLMFWSPSVTVLHTVVVLAMAATMLFAK